MDLEFFSIYPLIWTELIAALGAGVVIGMERQMMGKPAGMRTSVMICLSAYLFVAISKSMYSDYLRVVGQVVTGVGFLGGGVILSREGVVSGITTASIIWMLAAVGTVIGLGFPAVGVKAAIVAVIALLALGLVEKRHKPFQRGIHKKRKRQGF